MEAHSSLGDGQSQSDSAGLPSSSIIQAIEWLKQLVQGVRGHTWPGIAHPQHSLPSAPGLAFQFNFDRRSFLRVPDGVAHNVLYGTVQQRQISPDFPIALRNRRVHVAVTFLSFKLSVFADTL